MKTYIYTLRREDENFIRYIGKTIRLKRRYIEHTSESSLKSSHNNHLKNWILKAKSEAVKLFTDEKINNIITFYK